MLITVVDVNKSIIMDTRHIGGRFLERGERR
jgi:hypothetical protein